MHVCVCARACVRECTNLMVAGQTGSLHLAGSRRWRRWRDASVWNFRNWNLKNRHVTPLNHTMTQYMMAWDKDVGVVLPNIDFFIHIGYSDFIQRNINDTEPISANTDICGGGIKRLWLLSIATSRMMSSVCNEPFCEQLATTKITRQNHDDICDSMISSSVVETSLCKYCDVLFSNTSKFD